MRLNEMLLENSEEFFELIANEERSAELTGAIDSLREFLERDIDGWTSHGAPKLLREVKNHLMEIWGLISRPEKLSNSVLKEYYDQITFWLEHSDGYRRQQDNEFGEGLFDIGDRSKSVMDSQDLMYREDE